VAHKEPKAEAKAVSNHTEHFKLEIPVPQQQKPTF